MFAVITTSLENSQLFFIFFTPKNTRVIAEPHVYCSSRCNHRYWKISSPWYHLQKNNPNLPRTYMYLYRTFHNGIVFNSLITVNLEPLWSHTITDRRYDFFFSPPENKESVSLQFLFPHAKEKLIAFIPAMHFCAKNVLMKAVKTWRVYFCSVVLLCMESGSYLNSSLRDPNNNFSD